MGIGILISLYIKKIILLNRKFCFKMKKSSSIECLILKLTSYLLTNVSKTVVINEGYYSSSNDKHINPIGENVLPLD